MVFFVAEDEHDFVADVNAKAAEEWFNHVWQGFEVLENKIKGYGFFKGHGCMKIA
jgi:hypothetical protein